MADAKLQLIIDVVGNVSKQLNSVAADLKRVTDETNRLTQATNRLGAQGSANISKLSVALDKAESGFKSLNNAGQQFVSTGTRIAAIGAGLAAGGLFPVKIASDFESAMKGVVAVTTGARENYEALANEAKRLGRETAFTATEAAEGFKLLGQAGLTAEEAIVALEPALNLAAAGGLSLAESADISTNVLKGFGLATEDLTRVTDILANTATSANTNITDLGQAMSFAAPAAKAAGVEIAAASAAVGVLGDAGVKATRAGTGLRAILTRLSDPKIAKKLSDIGIAVEETADGGIDLISTFENIGEKAAAGTFGLAESTEIFGRNFSTTALIIAENVERLKELTEANRNAEGTAKATADTMLEGLGGALVELKSAAQGLAIEIGEPLLQPMENLVDQIKEVVQVITQWVIENPKLASTIAGLAGGLGALLTVVGLLGIAIGGLLQVIGFAGLGFVKFGKAVVALTGWLRASTLQMNVMSVSAKGLAASLGFVLLAITALIAGWQIGKIINEMRVWRDLNSQVGDVIQFTFARIERDIVRLILAYEKLALKTNEFLGLDTEDNIAEIKRLERELEIINETAERIVREGESRKYPVNLDVNEEEAKRKIAGVRSEAEKKPDLKYASAFEENLAEVNRLAKETGAGIDQDLTEEFKKFEYVLVETKDGLKEFKFPREVADEAQRTKQEIQLTKEQLEDLKIAAEQTGVPFETLKQQALAVEVPAETTENVKQISESAKEGTISMRELQAAIDVIVAKGIRIKVLIENFEEVTAQLAQLTKPETKEVTVRITEERTARTGGLMERMMSFGGKLAGYGGGDRIRAMLEAGEFVVRKEAVRKYGVGFMHMVNSMSLNMQKIPGMLAAQLGGMIPPTPRYQYQTGGTVTGGLNVDDLGVVELRVGNQGFPVMSTKSTMEELKIALRRGELLRSN
jgi:TP901 family phage tail tape measure protein